ncbi:1-acyl-sn-glycerol-3-phosphate acyltransferase [Sodalis-like secondary symbiont of Drepanosiphum platanoidis]|uniref:1-acyl-sn-glycerol-3-phosphate acyltransferase n=1 Tax=Sodalis-like secondary symbiont of Drepanosiphum platanoidis TaxID=2994493 RepID=UPI003464AFD1
MIYNFKKKYNIFLYKIMNFFLNKKIYIKNIYENNFYIKNSYIYLINTSSKLDFYILRKYCLQNNLIDPLKPLKILNIIFPRYLYLKNIKKKYSNNTKTFIKKNFYKYKNLYLKKKIKDVKIILVSINIREINNFNLYKKSFLKKLLYNFKKIICLFFIKNIIFIHFSKKISLKKIIKNYKLKKNIINILIRLSSIYFYRYMNISIGYKKNIKKKFKKTFLNKILNKIILNKYKIKNISIKKLKINILNLFKEMSTYYSNNIIYFSNLFIKFFLNLLYKNIKTNNINFIHKLLENNNIIIYIPCHKSHMDYILISYILYNKGLMPPCIVAGNNLNFWPLGNIFRYLGAFFIKRRFIGNKLYYFVLKEYIIQLFNNNYQLEYFIEGSRSRTGYLLKAKIGILSIIIKYIILNPKKKIKFIPIYIGYEKILDNFSYIKELNGFSKKKENFINMIKSFIKLKKLGKSFINFGKPLSLNDFLNKKLLNYKKYFKKNIYKKEKWIISISKKISLFFMQKINNLTVINSINLCSIILLYSYRYTLSINELKFQINFYLNFLKKIKYSSEIIITNNTSKKLINNALKMKKIKILKNINEDIVYLSNNQFKILNFYKNNIQHIFIIPSLVSIFIINYSGISQKKLNKKVLLFYKILKLEFFLKFNNKKVLKLVNNIILEFKKKQLIIISSKKLYPKFEYNITLYLLSNILKDNIQRYAITFFIFFKNNCLIKEKILNEKNYILAKKISLYLNLNIDKFFYQTSFDSLINILKKNYNIKNKKNKKYNLNINNLFKIVNKLISSKILILINNFY